MLIPRFMDQTWSSKTIYNITTIFLLSLCLDVSSDKEITFLEAYLLYKEDVFVSHPTNLFEYVIIIK